MSSHAITRLVLVLSIGTLASAPSGAVTVVSNLDNSDDAQAILALGKLYPEGTTATPFTTGDTPATLNSITFMLTASPNSVAETWFGTLALDNAGTPGSVLETYPAQPIGNQADRLATFSSAGIALQPHTTYWVIAGYNGIIASWLSTSLPDEISAYGWTIGDATLGHFTDGSWAHRATPPFPIGRMSIDATLLPDPSTPLAACCLALPLTRRRRR